MTGWIAFATLLVGCLSSAVLWLFQRRQIRRNGPTLVRDLKALWGRPVLVAGKEHHPKVKVLWADRER